jgi:hypothetical protein
MKVLSTCYPRYMVGFREENLCPRPMSGKSLRPYLKKTTKGKSLGGVTQLVECLLNNYEALSSNPDAKEKKDIETIQKGI